MSVRAGAWLVVTVALAAALCADAKRSGGKVKDPLEAPKFEELDKNKDGHVDSEELEAALHEKTPKGSLSDLLGPVARHKVPDVHKAMTEEARAQFRGLDKDKSDSVDKAEYDTGIKGAVKNFMGRLQKEAIAALMAAGDELGEKSEL